MKILLLTMFFLPAPLVGQTLSVVHVKALWSDGKGKVEITEKGISYEAEKPKESRTWSWPDIQYFDRLSETEFVILTYEDQRLLLGRDKEYRFRITEGRMTDDLLGIIASRLGKPLTDRVVRQPESPDYTLPVKHLHTFGGCQGTLEFTNESIFYRTDDKEDAREWKLDRDIQSVWSADEYHLEIYAYDNNRREFSRTRLYRFELKKPLDSDFYYRLKLRLYHFAGTQPPD